ncbi:hypothetical protein GCM10009608_74810 [Pseudonocardia alaniniphila]
MGARPAAESSPAITSARSHGFVDVGGASEELFATDPPLVDLPLLVAHAARAREVAGPGLTRARGQGYRLIEVPSPNIAF